MCWSAAPSTPNYNQNIIEVNGQKYLGIYLSNEWKRHTHIGYVTDNAWKKVNSTRKLKFILDRKELEIIHTFLRPLFEYNSTRYELEELNKIQNECARIATGTTELVSFGNLL